MSDLGSGLLDTSVFVARETGRQLEELPSKVAVSVVTIGELQLGVLVASDPSARALRADTLALARAADPIPISEAIMVAWARLVVDCRDAGIHRTVKLTDALIAATAIEHGLTVVTQDDDYWISSQATVSSMSVGTTTLSPSSRHREW
jgi:predicted nucleic acid-binding protein